MCLLSFGFASHRVVVLAVQKEETKWNYHGRICVCVCGWVGRVALLKFPGGFDFLEPYDSC